MDTITLENLWDTVVYKGNSFFEFRRIDSVCIPELNIGYNSQLNRCLILELPVKSKLNFQSKLKQNITLYFFKDTNYIVLQLIDFNYYDLFNDLIISIYHRIKHISGIDEYSQEIIIAFNKWAEFFEEKKTSLLSEEVIKGIIGELLVLKYLIQAANNPGINYLLNSWKGPYDKGNDFELENKNLEVKTKSPTGIDIKISSEFQLKESPGKGLELFVVSLISDSTIGIHLRDLILEIRKMVQGASGDNTILWKALSQKNITSKNMSQYDGYRFKPINWVTYNCADENFPKLTNSNISEAITSVKYTLRTSMLKTFIIDQKEF